MNICANINPEYNRYPAMLDTSFHFNLTINMDIVFLSISLSRKKQTEEAVCIQYFQNPSLPFLNISTRNYILTVMILCTGLR
jgi:hypothetical protein